MVYLEQLTLVPPAVPGLMLAMLLPAAA